MLKPPHFDPAKKYPLLVYVYGEPAAQTVLDEWGTWNNYFNRAAAAAGYVVVSFDNRGTPAPKGRAWRKIVYGAIQPVIVKDQSAALQAFLRTHIRSRTPSRVAIWGWSGGATSTLCLLFPLSEFVQAGNGRRAGSRSAPLRHDLSGTLHGIAASKRGWLSQQLSH